MAQVAHSAVMAALRMPYSATSLYWGRRGGLDLSMVHVLPVFLLLSGASSVGLRRRSRRRPGRHLSGTTLEHLGETLAAQPVPRARLARMQIRTDQARALLADTVAAAEAGRP